MVMRQVTWLNNSYVSKVVSQKRDRIDEIDDCHSCFMAGPWEKKTPCNVSYQSSLALFISYLTAAKSFKCKDFGVGQFSYLQLLPSFPQKKLLFFSPSNQPGRKRIKHTLPERAYQLNQKFWSTLSHFINKTMVNPWLRGHDGSAWQLLKLLKLTRCRICCCRGYCNPPPCGQVPGEF